MSLYREICNMVPGIGTGTQNQAGVRVAQPVIGRPHAATGSAINWLMGRGHALAVMGPCLWYGWLDATFSFWIWPDDLHQDYTWWIGLSARDGLYRPVTISGEITIPGIDGADDQVIAFSTPSDGTVYTLKSRQVAPTPSATPLEVTCTIAPAIETPEFETPAEDLPYLLLHGIHIMESSQVFLDGKGVATSTLEARQPIYWNIGEPPDGSITTLVQSTKYAHENYARRGQLFNWWDPFAQWSTASTSFTSVFPGDIKPAIQTRLISLGQSLASIKVRVCARVSGGTGEVRVTMTNGSTHTWTVSSAVNEWQDEVTLQAECDDPDRWPTDGGIRGGTRDEVTLEARAISGTIYVVGLSICETPTTGGDSESANVLVDGDGDPITYEDEYIFV